MVYIYQWFLTVQGEALKVLGGMFLNMDRARLAASSLYAKLIASWVQLSTNHIQKRLNKKHGMLILILFPLF